MEEERGEERGGDERWLETNSYLQLKRSIHSFIQYYVSEELGKKLNTLQRDELDRTRRAGAGEVEERDSNRG